MVLVGKLRPARWGEVGQRREIPEMHLGNPETSIPREEHQDCGICPYCRGDNKKRRIVPILDRQGTEKVFFDVFNPPVNTLVINPNRDAWTVEVLVREIRSYPNSTYLLLRSRVKGGISPDNLKRIVFCLLLKGMLQLDYDETENRAVFSLRHSDIQPSQFAMKEGAYWEGIDVK